MKPPIYVVNENDEVIGEKDRDDVDFQNDIYRVSAVWVVNSNGQTLIAQRKLTKKKDPGLWGPSVAGTVEVGETYYENAVKETEEELGVANLPLVELGKIRVASPQNYFAMYYKVLCDWPVERFVPQEDEVETLTWISVDELKKDVKLNPQKYIASMDKSLASLDKVGVR